MSSDARRICFISNEYAESKELVEDAKKIIVSYPSLLVVDDGSADIIVPVGGDGAFINACKRTNFNENCFYVGINTGKVGFLQELQYTELTRLIDYLANVDLYNVKKLPLLSITFCFESYEKEYKAVNEIEIAGLYNKTVDFSQYIDSIYFHDIRASGIVISSPTGSTALNRSCGGPILIADDYLVSTLRCATINPSRTRYEKQPIVAKETEIVFPDISKERNKNQNFNRFRNEVYFSIDGKVLKIKDTNYLKSIKVEIGKNYLKTISINCLSRVDNIREKLLT